MLDTKHYDFEIIAKSLVFMVDKLRLGMFQLKVYFIHYVEVVGYVFA